MLCIQFTLLPSPGWTGCPLILCFPRPTFDAKLLHFDPLNGQKLNLVAFTGLNMREGGTPLTTLLNTLGIKEQFCPALHRSQLSKYFPLHEVYFCCYPVDEASAAAAAALSIRSHVLKKTFLRGQITFVKFAKKI